MSKDRRRAASDEPRLTEPLPLVVGGDGGGGCIELDLEYPYVHSHHHHPTRDGLIEHLKIRLKHNWAKRFVDKFGEDLIREILDEAFDEDGRPTLEGIRSPIAWVVRQVQDRHAEAQAAATPDSLSEHADDLQKYRNRRAGGSGY